MCILPQKGEGFYFAQVLTATYRNDSVCRHTRICRRMGESNDQVMLLNMFSKFLGFTEEELLFVLSCLFNL